MKNNFLFLLLYVCSTIVAQEVATPFVIESESGYTGNNIPELTYLEDSFNFVVIGDFGRVGDYYQKQVAREMGHAMNVLDAEFVVSVGDNFYPNGVASTTDHHWLSSFEQIYTDPSLYRDWYLALGNHDYQGNVQAQIDYSQVSRRWNMPSRYFSKTMKLKNDEKVLLVVMDTNPFIDGYHKNPEKYIGVKEQDTTAQMNWLKQTLNTSDSAIKWKIVVGHHPMYSGGHRKDSKDTKLFEAKFATFFDEYKVDAYVCGHEHDLQIIKPEGKYTTQFLSGAGSEIRKSGEREGTIFAASVPGFLTFTILGNRLLVQAVKANETTAEVVYKHEIVKK
jgi:metallophosphoesterase superfamily enzyme